MIGIELLDHTISEFQPRVLVAAAGAPAEVGPARRRIDVVAADAVERRLPPLTLEAAVIAAVVVQPKPEEEQAHERAEDDCAGGEIEHAFSKRSLAVDSRKMSRGALRGTERDPHRLGESNL